MYTHYILIYQYSPRHPNISWEGVLNKFEGPTTFSAGGPGCLGLLCKDICGNICLKFRSEVDEKSGSGGNKNALQFI